MIEAGEVLDDLDILGKTEQKYIEEHPEEKVFKELLNEALQYSSYKEPP